MTLRLIVILVVLSTVIGSRQPAAVAAPAPTAGRTQRAQFIERLAVGLSNPITRAALLQRVAFAPPATIRPRVMTDAAPVPPRPQLTRVQLRLPPPHIG